MKLRELKPVLLNREYLDEIEDKILKLLKREIYFPIMRVMGEPQRTLKNDYYTDLIRAINDGQIQYVKGHFEGKINAAISRELRKIGATWDRKNGYWKLPSSSLTYDMRIAMAASESRFKRLGERVRDRVAQVLPESVADKLNLERIFDKTLYRFNRTFEDSIGSVALGVPKLTDFERERIAKEYTNNMRLHIMGWIKSEILDLREKVQKQVMSGVRYETLVDTIRKSYGVGRNKAKFLARQESHLLLSKFRSARYQQAGINQYKWKTVNMPSDGAGAPHTTGNVRHDHAVLDGTIQDWKSPPIVDQKTGRRAHAGEDYNCRCTSWPVVKF